MEYRIIQGLENIDEIVNLVFLGHGIEKIEGVPYFKFTGNRRKRANLENGIEVKFLLGNILYCHQLPQESYFGQRNDMDYVLDLLNAGMPVESGVPLVVVGDELLSLYPFNFH
ncbi:MAG: hypothetical protein ACOCXG_01655 [Nanoarchaeota archaeon]